MLLFLFPILAFCWCFFAYHLGYQHGLRRGLAIPSGPSQAELFRRDMLSVCPNLCPDEWKDNQPPPDEPWGYDSIPPGPVAL